MSNPHPNTGTSRGQDSRRDQTVFRDPFDGSVILRITWQPNGLIVVDLECDEAAFFAKALLPPTKVLDRPGKPKSRYVYRSRTT